MTSLALSPQLTRAWCVIQNATTFPARLARTCCRCSLASCKEKANISAKQNQSPKEPKVKSSKPDLLRNQVLCRIIGLQTSLSRLRFVAFFVKVVLGWVCFFRHAGLKIVLKVLKISSFMKLIHRICMGEYRSLRSQIQFQVRVR